MLNLRWEKNYVDEFNVKRVFPINKIDTIRVHRCEDNLMNDGTYYESISDNRQFYKAREYYWMIDHYIWELVPAGNNVHVKLVADDLNNMYLNVTKDVLNVTPKPCEWVIIGDKKIKSGTTTICFK